MGGHVDPPIAADSPLLIMEANQTKLVFVHASTFVLFQSYYKVLTILCRYSADYPAENNLRAPAQKLHEQEC